MASFGQIKKIFKLVLEAKCSASFYGILFMLY